MSKDRKLIPKGICFVISTGEYSDYSFNELLVSLTEITIEMQDEAADHLRANLKPDDDDFYYGESGLRDKWPTELVRRGWAVPLTYVEIHTGSCGEFDLGTKISEENE